MFDKTSQSIIIFTFNINENENIITKYNLIKKENIIKIFILNLVNIKNY